MRDPAPVRRAPIARIPLAFAGMRIGLLGGSFNPPHAAHRDMSLFARKRLGLRRVWWLVTPGNPLKSTRDLPPLAERMARARALAASPFIDVTNIEAMLGTRFTFDTVRRLRSRFPGVRFVFVMGADNLAQFQRWRRWRELARLLPIAVVDRPGWSFAPVSAPAAIALARSRVPEPRARALAQRKPPAWVSLHGMRSPLSSTELRRAGQGQREG